MSKESLTSIWLMPEDPEYPHASIPEDSDLPYIPIKRKGWFFDLRDQTYAAVYYNGKRVNGVTCAAIRVSAGEGLTAYLTVVDASIVSTLDEEEVQVSIIEPPIHDF